MREVVRHRTEKETYHQGVAVKDDKKSRFPPVAMLLLGPILGLIYVIALPFIATGTIVILVGRKVLGGMFNYARNIVSFGWRPTEAYLSGKKKKKKSE